MVWVNEIVDAQETSGHCRVTLNGQGFYISPLGLRPSSCLEFIAQSYGYGSVAYKRSINPKAKPLKRTLLAGFKKARMAAPSVFSQITPPSILDVEYSGVRQISKITTFHGVVRFQNTVLCEADLKVFCED